MFASKYRGARRSAKRICYITSVKAHALVGDGIEVGSFDYIFQGSSVCRKSLITMVICHYINYIWAFFRKRCLNEKRQHPKNNINFDIVLCFPF